MNPARGDLYVVKGHATTMKGEAWMLELTHVTKSYENVTRRKAINLKIKDGEIVSILGPSGCGKTT